MRRAKIVCTLGPATTDHEVLRQLVDAGMDVARLNMSHGTHADMEQLIASLRRIEEESGHAIAVLVDLQGPKIRTGTFADGPVELEPGQRFTITTREVGGDATEVGTTYPGLAADVSAGDRLLVNDGAIQLRAVEVTDTDVRTEVLVGGPLSDHKGINLPGVEVSTPALTEKDAEDLRWALGAGADLVALSFVRRPEDLEPVHAIMEELDNRVPVIAKVEKPQAVDRLEEIVEAFDGIMVARGDLGVEMPLEDVPVVQKRAVELTRRRAKPVIVATQVLESMISSPRPTRAEASDCANAVLDGADAVMLSGETSIGINPVECVKVMTRIIESTEEHGLDRMRALGKLPHTVTGAVTAAAVEVGREVDAKAYVTFTTTGTSARKLARTRPAEPVLAFTPHLRVRRQLALTWGLEAVLVPGPLGAMEGLFAQVDEALSLDERFTEGDRIIVVAGTPVGVPGSVNTLRVHSLARP
ncbi:pyruvate kinase [Kytococcus aerolatus]|uniref:Pyruvate kinase n=1 Tax=Kytococcus aerolatus TaxID=592308 RepID=A0A212T056_9MICO|nr:pyruvate kinase [Kytococcus aerolatus]SNC59399.1 pyruvate kinase [Kytococcus aerolatus]